MVKKMKTKTFRFHFWNMKSGDWNLPHSERTSKAVDKTWTMPSDTDLHNYAEYERNHIGAYKFEEVYNNEK